MILKTFGLKVAIISLFTFISMSVGMSLALGSEGYTVTTNGKFDQCAVCHQSKSIDTREVISISSGPLVDLQSASIAGEGYGGFVEQQSNHNEVNTEEGYYNKPVFSVPWQI